MKIVNEFNRDLSKGIVKMTDNIDWEIFLSRYSRKYPITGSIEGETWFYPEDVFISENGDIVINATEYSPRGEYSGTYYCGVELGVKQFVLDPLEVIHWWGHTPPPVEVVIRNHLGPKAEVVIDLLNGAPIKEGPQLLEEFLSRLEP